MYTDEDERTQWVVSLGDTIHSAPLSLLVCLFDISHVTQFLLSIKYTRLAVTVCYGVEYVSLSGSIVQ